MSRSSLSMPVSIPNRSPRSPKETRHDPCWTDERDRLLIRTADALHDNATIDTALHDQLRTEFADDQLLDIYMLCGWYHAISFTANAAGVALEPGAATFTDHSPV